LNIPSSKNPSFNLLSPLLYSLDTDVLIFSIDNLTGISETIEAVFPRAEVQKCIVHQIRNSLRYVTWKERKAMAKDPRSIYEAATEEEGAEALSDFSAKWDKRYPHVSGSWKKN